MHCVSAFPLSILLQKWVILLKLIFRDSNVLSCLKWDHDNPADRSRWHTQHDPLSKLGPPYVYNVFRNDTKGFVQAIKAALENPIERFVTSMICFDQEADRLFY